MVALLHQLVCSSLISICYSSSNIVRNSWLNFYQIFGRHRPETRLVLDIRYLGQSMVIVLCTQDYHN